MTSSVKTANCLALESNVAYERKQSMPNTRPRSLLWLTNCAWFTHSKATGM